jgi:hypothetical protein
MCPSLALIGLVTATAAAQQNLCLSDNDLTDVVLGSGRVSPPFNPCTVEYTASVSVDTLVMRLPATGPDTLVAVNGSPLPTEESLTPAIPLAFGRNTFTVSVASNETSVYVMMSSSTTTANKKYTIHVDRVRPSEAEVAKAARVAAGKRPFLAHLRVTHTLGHIR